MRLYFCNTFTNIKTPLQTLAMKKMQLLLVLTLITIATNAQRKNAFTGFLNFNLSFPSGEFKKVNNTIGAGARLGVLYNPSNSLPLYIGAELGYQVMGQDNSYFYSSYYGFTDEYRITASNNVFTVLANIRLQSNKNTVAVKPFAEVLFGANDFFSTTTVERQTYYSSGTISNSNSSKARWAMCYGGAVGLDIRLDKKGSVGLELRTSYLKGAKTKYLTDPIIDNAGYVSYAEKESETDMFVAQVGVKIGF